MIDQMHARKQAQWAAAGVGHLYPARPNPRAEPVEPPVVQAQAVPAGLPVSLWQSRESGGLGLALFPQLIEAGVHDLSHISGGSASGFSSFDELRQRFPTIPLVEGGGRRGGQFDRGPAFSNQTRFGGGQFDRGPAFSGQMRGYGTSMRTRYEQMVEELRAAGVQPMGVVPMGTTQVVQASFVAPVSVTQTACV